jgi:outer membrane immunogenic protein
MKNILLSTAAVAAILTPSIVAQAADIPQRSAPPPAYVPVAVPVFSWTGFYIGGNIGGAWHNTNVDGNFTGASWHSDRSGFFGGGQIGANYQFDRFVVGIEGDIGSTPKGKSSPFVPTALGPLQVVASANWVSTLAARFGVAADHWLFYTKLGGGWADAGLSLQTSLPSTLATVSRTNAGWLVGGGVEYAFTNNWSTKLEYEYLGLSNRTFSGVGLVGLNSVSASTNIQMVKLGLNYRFGM